MNLLEFFIVLGFESVIVSLCQYNRVLKPIFAKTFGLLHTKLLQMLKFIHTIGVGHILRKYGNGDVTYQTGLDRN